MDPKTQSWGKAAGAAVGGLTALYVFLVGLALMGTSFKCLGGRGASSVFESVDNPIAGLMTGVLATVLVQSSSTSTSIVVGLVGSDQISVKTGIPIIMGANIGTSVTNTIVSMGQVGDRIELERAFAGATVHDMFNMLTVATLLPIEVIIGAIQGEGGPLYWLTKAITDNAVEGDPAGELFESPIKTITKPLSSLFIEANKYVIYALTLGEPDVYSTEGLVTNQTLCAAPASSRRLEEAAPDANSGSARALFSRRLDDDDSAPDCSTYSCVSKDLDKNFKKISKKSYKKLLKCDDYIISPVVCDDKCYLDGYDYYQEYVEDSDIIKGGFLEGAGDTAGSLIGLVISLVFLCGGLYGLVKMLQYLFLGRANAAIVAATKMNDYFAILVGIGITIVVQSSSVTTSALTPLAGMGAITLEKMLPLTLGANIGTTVTAMLASLVDLKPNAVHIAFCHLFFNIIGILIWFPFPLMRQVPLGAARLLGLYASFYRVVPALYILFAFVFVPGVALAISAIFEASVAGGVVVLLFVLALVGAFVYWWVWMEGCYRVLSAEDRAEGRRKLAAANEELTGSRAQTNQENAEAVQKSSRDDAGNAPQEENSVDPSTTV